MSARQPRFEIVRTDSGYHSRFRAANGRIVWVTENYRRHATAHDALFQLGKFAYKDSTPWTLALQTQRYGFLEVREVDERTPKCPAPTATLPIWEGVALGGRSFLHDQDYHWRMCSGDDCREVAHVVERTIVRTRFGDAEVKP